MRHFKNITLTIANTETDSNIYDLTAPAAGNMVDFVVYTPAALTGTVTLYAGANASTLLPVYINGANVTLPAAKAVPIPMGGVRALQVKSGSAEGADRVFTVVIQFDLS